MCLAEILFSSQSTQSNQVGTGVLLARHENPPRQERKVDRCSYRHLWQGVSRNIDQKGKGRVEPHSPVGKGDRQGSTRPLQGRTPPSKEIINSKSLQEAVDAYLERSGHSPSTLKNYKNKLFSHSSLRWVLTQTSKNWSGHREDGKRC